MEDTHTGKATAAITVTVPEWPDPGKILSSAMAGEEEGRVRAVSPRRIIVVQISVDKQKYL